MGPHVLLTLAGIFAIVAVALTAQVIAHPAPLPGDVTILRAVQDHSSWQAAARVVNRIGDFWWAAFLLVFLLLLLGIRALGPPLRGWERRAAPVAAFAAGLVLAAVNPITKALVDSPRPSPAFGVFVDHARRSAGFPSGHVYNDVLFFGLIAVFAPSWVGPRLVPVVRAAAIGVILLAGWARMVVGAHWPSDVLGGYLWGLAALAFATALGSILARRRYSEAANP